MDTSKEYIKMCEKAVEVQGGWTPSFGDFIVSADRCMRSKKSPRNLLVVIQYAPKNFGDNISEKLIYSKAPNQTGDNKYKIDKVWLPRQDQLQGIVKGEITATAKHFYFHDWVRSNYQTVYSFGSMEQLWLAFVMRELWDKTWYGRFWK